MVWIGLKLHLRFLLFLFFQVVNVDFLCEQYICALFTVPQTSFFNNFFMKNGFHDTINIFKNYFVTMFSVFSFSKISSIQTDPNSLTNKKHVLMNNYFCIFVFHLLDFDIDDIVSFNIKIFFRLFHPSIIP